MTLWMHKPIEGWQTFWIGCTKILPWPYPRFWMQEVPCRTMASMSDFLFIVSGHPQENVFF